MVVDGHSKPIKTRKQLEALHGTPTEFAAAVRKAVGEISWEEADAAITKYMAEWNHAPNE